MVRTAGKKGESVAEHGTIRLRARMAPMECNDSQRCAWKVGSNHLIHYAEILPMMHHISAVTFVVRAMPEAITFYTTLGFTLVYSGPENQFTTLQAGDAFVNLTLSPLRCGKVDRGTL